MNLTIPVSFTIIFALMIFGFMSLPDAYVHSSSNFEGCGFTSNSDYGNFEDQNFGVEDEPFLLWLIENNCSNIVDVWKMKASDHEKHD